MSKEFHWLPVVQKGPIPPPDAVNYIDQILAALSYTHRQNIVHRDIKPANMILSPGGVVKLTDFGIARSASDRGLTMTGSTLGSLNYMPPEQVKGEAADARSLFCGYIPVRNGHRPPALSNRQLLFLDGRTSKRSTKTPSADRTDLSQALDQILLLAVAKDPKQRFQSADAFGAALKSVVFPEAQTVFGGYTSAPPARAATATALFEEKVGARATDQLFAAPPEVPQHPIALPFSVRQSGHRGLYLALGALLALVVLGAAGVYLPRRISTRADGDNRRPTGRSSDSSSVPNQLFLRVRG